MELRHASKAAKGQINETEVTQKAHTEQICSAVTKDFVLENSLTQNSRERASLENSKDHTTKMSFIYKLSQQTQKRIYVL